jgi:hypothetical protein
MRIGECDPVRDADQLLQKEQLTAPATRPGDARTGKSSEDTRRWLFRLDLVRQSVGI